MRFSVVGLLSLLIVATFAVQTAVGDTLDSIRSRGALVIGFREAAPPFSFIGTDKRPAGYSIDICNRIAADVKAALGVKKLDVRYVPVTAANRIEKLESGEIDIECGTATRTISREARVDFTLFTFLSGAELLVPQTSDIHAPSDVANKKIAVQPGTTTEREIKRILNLRLINADFIPVKNAQEGSAFVQSGKADAYAGDQAVLIGLAAKADPPGSLRLSGYLYSYEPYALMVRKNDTAFRVIADRTLALIFQNGDIVKIYQRWFGGAIPGPPSMLQALFAIQSLPP